VTSTVTAGPDNSPTASSCGTAPPAARGCVVEVQVQYHFGFLSTFFLPKSTVAMSSASEMVISR
jgi:hypothetical protein